MTKASLSHKPRETTHLRLVWSKPKTSGSPTAPKPKESIAASHVSVVLAWEDSVLAVRRCEKKRDFCIGTEVSEDEGLLIADESLSARHVLVSYREGKFYVTLPLKVTAYFYELSGPSAWRIGRKEADRTFVVKEGQRIELHFERFLATITGSEAENVLVEETKRGLLFYAFWGVMLACHLVLVARIVYEQWSLHQSAARMIHMAHEP